MMLFLEKLSRRRCLQCAGIWGVWPAALAARILWLITTAISLSNVGVTTWLIGTCDTPALSTQLTLKHAQRRARLLWVLQLPDRLVALTAFATLLSIAITSINYAPGGWVACVAVVVFAVLGSVTLIWHFVYRGLRWQSPIKAAMHSDMLVRRQRSMLTMNDATVGLV